MKFEGAMLVVKDIKKSEEFYIKVLGVEKILDFGANITLTGGFSLQEQTYWEGLINKDSKSIKFGGNDAELYFEEDDFDKFVEKLEKIDGIDYVTPIHELPWGQRSVSFYDLDKHILEVAENLKSVCIRFKNSGMTPEEVAKRMDVPLEFVNECLA